MKKILWMSQHSPIEKQLVELRRLFGEVEVSMGPRQFTSAEEIAKRFRDGGFAEMVIVAPMSVIARVVDLGVRPLWAEMEVVPNRADADAEARGRFYRFARFRRIKALRFEFEDF